jgi:high-affinity Fe2+/Pb2+ permease
MALEDALVGSANGDFGLILIAFLCVSLVGGFLWAIRKVIDQNSNFNAAIVQGMKDVISEMKEYRRETCAELKAHDEQAKRILSATEQIATTLNNRPCINGGK